MENIKVGDLKDLIKDYIKSNLKINITDQYDYYGTNIKTYNKIKKEKPLKLKVFLFLF